MSQRLYPEQRIRKRQTFQTLFKKGRCMRGRLLNVWVYEKLKDPQASRPMIGIVVSKKVSLRANKRNLWKRRIREAFRFHQTNLKTKLAIVVQAKRQEKMPSYQAVSEEFERLLIKAKSLKK